MFKLHDWLLWGKMEGAVAAASNVDAFCFQTLASHLFTSSRVTPAVQCLFMLFPFCVLSPHLILAMGDIDGLDIDGLDIDTITPLECFCSETF
jgi:hypothetical protein